MTEDIINVINALRDARIPIILIVGGILFLLLAIGVQLKFFTGKVNRKYAGGIGGLLLLAGIALSVPITTPAPSQILTNTPTPTECKLNNLINCSIPVPIMDGGGMITSTLASSGNLEIEFNNGQGHSGVAFQFTPAIAVQEFTHVEISGTSTEPFKFRIEYKVSQDGNIEIVADSAYQQFPADKQVSFRIPLTHDSPVDEIAVMFYEANEASEVTIESMRFSK